MSYPAKPDPELAALQLAENAKASAEGRAPIHYWLDPCKEVDFSDWDIEAARRQNPLTVSTLVASSSNISMNYNIA